MKLQNNYTTPEQSERLLKVGLPIDSADQVYYIDAMYSSHRFILPDHCYSEVVKGLEQLSIPCWSVGRLIEILLKCHQTANFNTLSLGISFHSQNIVEYLVIAIERNCNSFDYSKLFTNN